MEFALVGSAFLAMVLGILEIAFIIFAQVALDYATSQSARQLLTGNVNIASGASQTAFQSANFCGYLSGLIPCGNVLVTLQPLQSNANFQTALTSQAPPTGSTTVNPGVGGSLMLLQAYYTPGLTLWPISAPTLVSSAAFMNE
ncbi:MAG: pilus assembly protein [Rhodospirillales bacterium]|nr:pilus assembly protein [Acetobacter sp.]